MKVKTSLVAGAKMIGKKASKQVYTIGVITILLPALFKAYTIAQLFMQGKPESMTDTVYQQIIGLNFGCLLALLLMFQVNRKDIQQNKRKASEEANPNAHVYNAKRYSKSKHGMIKILSLILSLVNTILGIIIGVMIYVNVTSENNLMMLVVSILTILLDIFTLWSIYKFYRGQGTAVSGAEKLAPGVGRLISAIPR